MSDDDDAETGVDGEEDAQDLLPVLAVVGRPNVGKSTLVNRILGRREAVVEDVPGVTRDRVAYDAEWSGRRFTLLDTGGWEPDAAGFMARVAVQAELAVEAADAVMFVVDSTVGATDVDEQVVRVLRRSGKPVILAANKVDDQRGEAEAAALWSLGLGEPYPVSALHGRGSGDLLDAVLAALPEAPRDEPRPQGPRRVALLGKPNVGKSSLLNQLAGSERAVVDPIAGTTVDPVDELVTLGGKPWRFVDTAGIRRRVREASGHEYYAVLRTQAALEKAEVAVVLIDASEPLAEQDQRILSMVVEAGRAMVLAINKWDLVDEDRRYMLEREIERELVRLPWVPRVNISASTGRHVEQAGAGARGGPRVLGHPGVDRPAQRVPGRGGSRDSAAGARRQAAEGAVRHPGRHAAADASCVFTSGFLEAGYRRFLERRLREEFGFVGHHRSISASGCGRSAVSADLARSSWPPSIRVRAASAASDSMANRKPRAVAQLGSALDWGSRGRRFKSCQPDVVRSRETPWFRDCLASCPRNARLDRLGVVDARPRDRDELAQHVEVEVVELLGVDAAGALGVLTQPGQWCGRLRHVFESVERQLSLSG